MFLNAKCVFSILFLQRCCYSSLELYFGRIKCEIISWIHSEGLCYDFHSGDVIHGYSHGQHMQNLFVIQLYQYYYSQLPIIGTILNSGGSYCYFYYCTAIPILRTLFKSQVCTINKYGYYNRKLRVLTTAIFRGDKM